MCLLPSCGKSERSSPEEESGGSNSAGTPSTSGRSGHTAGTASSASGSATTAGGTATSAPAGGATSTAGSAATQGGEPASGGEENGGEAAGGAPSCDGSYHACGCGCCPPGVGVPILRCIYPDLGESLAEVIAADVAESRNTAQCATETCNRGYDYVCCAAPPIPSVPEDAEFTASLVIGGVNRLSLFKHGMPMCSTLVLVQGAPVDQSFPVEAPAGYAMQKAGTQRCISAAYPPEALGAVGRVAFRVAGNACVVDVHVAFFSGDLASGITAERMDADGIPLDAVSVGQCH